MPGTKERLTFTPIDIEEDPEIMRRFRTVLHLFSEMGMPDRRGCHNSSKPKPNGNGRGKARVSD